MKTFTILTLSILLAQILSSAVAAPTRKLLKPVSSLNASPRSIWIADDKGHLKEFDLDGNLIKDYPHTEEIIYSMVTTPDNKYLVYSSNVKSEQVGGMINLNQLSIETRALEKVYKNYSHDNELPLVASNDSKYVVAGTDIGGNESKVKVFHLEKKSQIGESPLGFGHDVGNTGLAISKDDKSVYVGGEYGGLLEVEISNIGNAGEPKFNWVKDFSKDSVSDEDANILSMTVSGDNEFLFISNEIGEVKQFSHKDQKFVANWGQVMGGQINKIVEYNGFLVVSDSKGTYVKGSYGHVKIFNTKNHKAVVDSGVMVESGIMDMVFDGVKQRILLAGGDSHVYEFCMKQGKIVKDWGKVMDGQIMAMTM